MGSNVDQRTFCKCHLSVAKWKKVLGSVHWNREQNSEEIQCLTLKICSLDFRISAHFNSNAISYPCCENGMQQDVC